jgi:hypothetical protein
MVKNRITLSDLGAPNVVLANTYFWVSGCKSKDRRYNEKYRLNQVYDWLEKLNEKYGLNMDIQIVDHTVNGYVDGKCVVYFYYKESCSYVYRKQNFKELLKLIKMKIYG